MGAWVKGIKLYFFVSWLFAVGVPATGQAEDKFYTGWLERIVLVPSGIKLRAKLDSGAKTPSIHASDIERFERDGNDWVRFRTSNLFDKKPKSVSIERPLVRTVRIKSHVLSARERPVINLSFCWNQKLFESEFTLTDRSHFNYPVLLGRSFLRHGFLVDSSRIFTHKTSRKKCLRRAETESGSADSKRKNKTNYKN